MRNNTTRVRKHSSELGQYRDALVQNNLQTMETLLHNHGENLYWCICGATCLSKKNNGLHRADCTLEYEKPSVIPHLEMSIELLNIPSLRLIKKLTTGRDAKLSLTSTQWVNALSEVIKSRDSRVAELFGYEWLIDFRYIPDRDKELYAQYVYDMFATMLANSENGFPRLNQTSLSKFIPILLPEYKDSIIWERFISSINNTGLGKLFLMRPELESFRKIMVEKYGILWKIKGIKLVKPVHVELIYSLIRYVLHTFLGRYRPEHTRWFNSLLAYKQYLKKETKTLVEKLMEDPLLYDGKLHYKRKSIAYFVPVPEARYSMQEASKIRIIGGLKHCCCFGLSKDEAEDEELLLSKENEFVF